MTDSEFFKDSKHTWPEGYTATRKFISLKGKLFTSFCAFYINQAVLSHICAISCFDFKQILMHLPCTRWKCLEMPSQRLALFSE